MVVVGNAKATRKCVRLGSVSVNLPVKATSAVLTDAGTIVVSVWGYRMNVWQGNVFASRPATARIVVMMVAEETAGNARKVGCATKAILALTIRSSGWTRHQTSHGRLCQQVA